MAGAEAECMFADDSGDDDEASVHSALSNESDFQEDEEADYLALELLHHLPPEKASRLLKNLRAKEKAVQDLLRRNKGLLDSCKQLDEENQTLSERLKEEETASAAAPVAAAAPPVDVSVFQQLEQGKEQRILRLTAENERLMMHNRRLDEGNRRLQEENAQMRKDVKKAQQQGRQQPTPHPSRANHDSASPAGDLAAVDEEERLFRELQSEGTGEFIVMKIQKREAEHRAQLQAALKAMLQEDLKRVERWGSDVTAVLLAVDALESHLRVGGRQPKVAKKGKAAAPLGGGGGGGTGGAEISSEVQEVSAQLLEDFDALTGELEDVAKDCAAAAGEVQDGLAAAEREAEWLREHNASWIDRVQGLSLEPVVGLVSSTEEAVRSLTSAAPPGLLPPHVERCLQESGERMSDLSSRLGGQARALAELQAESIAFGQRVNSLQALRRSPGPFQEPLARLRRGVKQQGEAFSRARARVTVALEEVAAAHRRGAAAAAAAEASSGGTGGSDHVGGGGVDALAELREVRGMGKALIASLEEGGRMADSRMSQVLNVLVGEVQDGGARQTSRGAAVSDEPRGEAGKKKKGKKKGSGGGGAGKPEGAGGAAAPAATVAAAGAAAADDRRRGEEPHGGAAAADGGSAGGADSATGRHSFEPASRKARPEEDEEAQIRAEFQQVFNEEGEGKRVLSGPELFSELQALRSGAEALEARMAARAQARNALAAQPEEAPASSGAATSAAVEKPALAASAARRRKKMYV